MNDNTDYIEIVKNEFERRKSKNKSYSLRAYARDLGISPSYLSKLLNSQVPLTERFVKRFQVITKNHSTGKVDE